MPKREIKSIKSSSVAPTRLVYLTRNNVCKPTAMTNRTITIANALQGHGYAVEIACLALQNSGEEKPKDLKEGIEVHFFSRRGKVKLLSHLLGFIRFFFKYAATERLSWYFFGFHEFMEPFFSGILLLRRDFVVREVAEYPGFTKELGNIQKRFLSMALRKADVIVVINKALEEYVAKLSDARIVVVNMTVDTGRFSQTEIPRKNIIAYCGNMFGGKDGVEDLIRAFAIFRSMVQEDFVLRLIGDISNEDLFGSLREVCTREKVEDFVEFTGLVNREEVPLMLSESKILVLARPDTYQAKGGFPTKLGEYLATGVPVIVTDVGEISSFVKDGINGFIAENNHPEIFARKMEEVVNNYDRAVEVGYRGRILAETEFSAESQITRLLPYMKNPKIV